MNTIFFGKLYPVIPQYTCNIIYNGPSKVYCIGVAPITQVTHVRNKNSNIQGRSLNVIKSIFQSIRNYS